MYEENGYTFGRLKQNFDVYQRVIVGGTSDPNFDGMTGLVYGKSFKDSLFDCYIIVFDDEKMYSGQRACSITEACLCPV